MNLYYLEMTEDDHRIPVGDSRGYPTLAAALTAAEKHTDDALPQNRIRVYQIVGGAYWGGDGDPHSYEIDAEGKRKDR